MQSINFNKLYSQQQISSKNKTNLKEQRSILKETKDDVEFKNKLSAGNFFKKIKDFFSNLFSKKENEIKDKKVADDYLSRLTRYCAGGGSN